MAATDVADDQLDLKKRARRRLVGAAALALTAVVVLPAVMDREPKPVAQDIQVRIPSQDGTDLATKSAPSKRTAAAENDDVAVAAPADAAAAAAAAIAAKTAVDAKPQQAAATEKAEAKPEPKQEAKTEAKPESKPDTKVAEAKTQAKPESKPAAKADSKPDSKDAKDSKAADRVAAKKEEARAAAALEGKTAAASGNGQWVVQIGAYQNIGNVKLIVGKMKELGVPSYTEKLDTPQGQRIRVRAGPFSSRDAAEKAQTKLKIIGVSGPVAQKQ